MKKNIDSDDNSSKNSIFSLDDLPRIIKMRMDELQMSRQDLSKKTGIDENTIKKYLKGTKFLSDEQVSKIIDAIGFKKEKMKYEIKKYNNSYWIFSYKRIVRILKSLRNEDQEEMISIMEKWADLKVQSYKEDKNQQDNEQR